MKREKLEVSNIKEIEEQKMNRSSILGITDLNKGEDARDYILKSAAGESGK